ncbi:hypothetical protein N781_13435 [Pontibacillus halophilus JSM 076056 = DSM 19796]|uniref:Uncharacterized protein n=2 Tax=Pontibacillus TaxID=289201 RepID=A0A0A5GPH7_9BACI|nr:hypothetical protein [Pontibacillus halophilus]KGX93045.1 hypothetical protein N781_13435 [Pontibacillus halophilus JSM 076056 = DSM 19796]
MLLSLFTVLLVEFVALFIVSKTTNKWTKIGLIGAYVIWGVLFYLLSSQHEGEALYQTVAIGSILYIVPLIVIASVKTYHFLGNQLTEISKLLLYTLMLIGAYLLIGLIVVLLFAFVFIGIQI